MSKPAHAPADVPGARPTCVGTPLLNARRGGDPVASDPEKLLLRCTGSSPPRVGAENSRLGLRCAAAVGAAAAPMPAPVSRGVRGLDGPLVAGELMSSITAKGEHEVRHEAGQAGDVL